MYKIKLNSHGAILQQYWSDDSEPAHNSTDLEGFKWVESLQLVPGGDMYWDGEEWQDCGPPPNHYSKWEGSWVDDQDEKDRLAIGVATAMFGKRNQLLNGSDWTQLPDNPLTAEKKAEWVTYRQLLRDYPPTNNPPAIDFDDLVWPTPPE